MSIVTLPLSELLKPWLSVLPEDDCAVSGLSLDSRQICTGFLFLAVRGELADGRDYIDQAIANGAVAILLDSASGTMDASCAVPLLYVDQLRDQTSAVAARFYQAPSQQLCVIGFTGTNAKTSCAFFAAQALKTLGLEAAVIGTTGYGAPDQLRKSTLTTPDPVGVQAQLQELRAEGFDAVCMEVSSHGLDQGRVSAVVFDYAVFTNLSQDHLDYHGSMAAYGEAKARLFAMPSLKARIINADDRFGGELLERFAAQKPLGFGLQNGEIKATNVRADASGMRFDLHLGDKQAQVTTALMGEINVENLLAIAALLTAMGYELDSIAPALAICRAPAGRLERISAAVNQPVVIVDYAHTPDALAKALQSLRPHCDGLLTVVLGCGGDRDRAKRPLMAKAAVRLADSVLLTDDNPRGEQPEAIVADIQAGLKQPVRVIHDRREAIRTAVREAAVKDWVLIAGKGHETEQVYADRVVAFDDRQEARLALEARAA